MKLKPDHFRHMRNTLATFGAERVAAHRDFIIREGKAKDVGKRLRWDLLYAGKLTPWICANVYPYANDSHVDTALRAIMRELYPEVAELARQNVSSEIAKATRD